MRILALDSSGLVASVAIVEEDNLLAEYTTNLKKTHSETLLPMIDALFSFTGTDLSEIDAIAGELDLLAATVGPGSFTGLRIGSATAKGLGMARNIPLIPVPSLEGMAYHFTESSRLICPMMDARRKQVYSGIYSFDGGKFTVVSKETAGPVSELAERINALGREVVFLGDGVPSYRETLESLIRVPHTYAPLHLNRQRAAAVGARAFDLYREGRVETASAHAPVYIRKSSAERELEARGGQLTADNIRRAH